MSVHDTDYTVSPVCPHCGAAQSDAHEWAGDEGEQDCGSCERTFSFQRVVEVHYTTIRRDVTLPRELASARRSLARSSGSDTAYHQRRIDLLEKERDRLIANGEWAEGGGE